MEKQQEITPILKWAGGKRKLLKYITPVMPKEYGTYCEPFIGGGAVLFSVQPEKAVISDANAELVNLYRTVKDDVDELITDLQKHANTPEYYYEMRKKDRNPEEYQKLSDVEKASRLIFLNWTCFNGLYRVNSKGEFNVPYGKYKSPRIVDADNLRKIHDYFNQNEIHMETSDFEDVLSKLKEGDFAYLDPPYDPVSETSNFTSYAKDGFSHEEQRRLKKICDTMTERKVKFLLSNSATEFIMDLYSSYDITVIKADRTINADASKRGKVEEVLVRNY